MIRRITAALVLALMLVSCTRSVSKIGSQGGAANAPGSTAAPTLAAGKENAQPAGNLLRATATRPAASTATALASTATAAPSPTVTQAPATPTLEPNPASFYALQPGTPLGITNTTHPEAGCDWTGLGGQVFGPDGNPLIGIIVEVRGSIDGKDVQLLGLTGSAPILGAGGYDFTLQSRPFASQGVLSVQLFDIDGTALSDPIYFDTYADCSRNMVLINFTAIPEKNPQIEWKLNLPYIVRGVN